MKEFVERLKGKEFRIFGEIWDWKDVFFLLAAVEIPLALIGVVVGAIIKSALGVKISLISLVLAVGYIYWSQRTSNPGE